jgi:hypothetical protein
MQFRFQKETLGLIAVVAAAVSFGSPSLGAEPRLAIGGYDTVAYFTDGEPILGKAEFLVVWHDARWQFASTAHRDLFISDPEHYAAQYDGHCAMGVSAESGHKDTVDPQAWSIVLGKLYINHDRHWGAVWHSDTATNISRADKNWLIVKDTPEPN